jgi:outer membrane protein assembly factor BamB
VYALDLATGRQLWHARFENDANGAAVSHDRVFVTSDDGYLRALTVGDGKPTWKVRSRRKMYTHPLVVGDQVVVGDADGYLRAFGVSDGKQRWEQSMRGAIRGGVAADADRIYAVSSGGTLMALTHHGQVLWGRGEPTDDQADDEEEPATWAEPAYSVPILYRDLVIVPFVRDTTYGTPALTAVERRSGRHRWSASSGAWGGGNRWGNIRTTPALVGDTLIYSEPYSGDVVGIQAYDGMMTFRHRVDDCYFPQWASPAAVGSLAYVPRFSGNLFAVSADGRVEWAFYLGQAQRAGKRALQKFPSGDRPTYRAGGCQWSLPKGHSLGSPAAVAPDGTLLVGSEEGWLYALH